MGFDATSGERVSELIWIVGHPAGVLSIAGGIEEQPYSHGENGWSEPK